MGLSWLPDLLKRRNHPRRKPILRVPFVGREEELAMLDAGLQEAMDGAQVFVVLEGPAGIGKSALLEEFLARRCRSSAVLPLTVNAAEFLWANDVFASMLAALQSRGQQINEKMFRDTRRLRSMKGLNWEEAEFTRMIAGTNRGRVARGAAPLASLLARVREHPWATGVAVALEGLKRAPDAAQSEPRQRFVDLIASMRDHIQTGSAVMVFAIDQVDGTDEAPNDTEAAEPVHRAWAAFAEALTGAGMPCLVVWAGTAEGIEPVRRALPPQTTLTTCALAHLADEEWRHLCQQVARCLPAAVRTSWGQSFGAGPGPQTTGRLFLLAAALVAEDSGPHMPTGLLSDPVEALVGRIVRRIARDHPDAASLWDELLDTWAFLPPGKPIGVEDVMIRCADDDSRPDPAALRTAIETLLGEGVRYGLLHRDPYSPHYVTGYTGVQASLRAFMYPNPATRRQWSRIRRLADGVLARAHEGQRDRLAVLADLVGTAGQADEELWNRALLTPFRRLLATCRVEERQRMAEALGGFSSPLAVALLRSMVRDTEGRIRSAAVQSLANLALPQAIDLLIEALSDANSDVRWIATRALGDLSGAVTVNALIPMLTDEDNEVSRVAAEALGQQADGRAVPHLIAALRERYPLLRESAVQALGHLGDERAVPALRDMLNDENLHVRQSAQNALKGFTVS